jgi:hypothetical protein
MYYIYSKRSGRLLLKTTDKEQLVSYLPSLVDVHYSH